jgi:hypothetical protein
MADLDGCDLSKLKRCPVCSRPFMTKRKDQKGCSPRCANVERVRRSRKNAEEYEDNRKFRRRTGLQAIRGRPRIDPVVLHEALRTPEGRKR